MVCPGSPATLHTCILTAPACVIASAISVTRRLGTMLVNRLPGPRIIKSASSMAFLAPG